MRARIHPTAIVHPEAVVGDDVEIGAYAIVGAGVRLGAGTRLAPHAVVEGPTEMGEGNAVSSFAVLGTAPQARAKGASPTEAEGTLRVGAGNVFREHDRPPRHARQRDDDRRRQPVHGVGPRGTTSSSDRTGRSPTRCRSGHATVADS